MVRAPHIDAMHSPHTAALLDPQADEFVRIPGAGHRPLEVAERATPTALATVIHNVVESARAQRDCGLPLHTLEPHMHRNAKGHAAAREAEPPLDKQVQHTRHMRSHQRYHIPVAKEHSRSIRPE
jgi:hypothetical protein